MQNGGYQAMLHDLLEFDLKDVNLRTIPRTQALFEQKCNSMTTVQKFWYERLQDGLLLQNQIKWDDPVSFPDLYSAYKVFADDIKDRHPMARQQFGTPLNQICKGIRERKLHVKSVRVIHKIFPTLEECRRQFEVSFKMEGQITWEHDDGPNEQVHVPTF